MYQVTETISKQVVESSKLLKRFIYSQYFSDGFRITLGMLFPALLAYNLGYVNEGIAISLGALCVSIPDSPGAKDHRRNAMLITLGLIGIASVVTALLSKYSLLMSLFLSSSFFGLTMLHVFGSRAAGIGVAAMLVIILGIDQSGSIYQALTFGGLVIVGGIWYYILSISIQSLMPYRAAKQLVGECTLAIAEFIRLKAGFYNNSIVVNEQYQKILKQQISINELQEHVREILFKTRKILVDPTPTGKELLLSFVDLVDLYEQSMATHYDYEKIRKSYENTTILSEFEKIIMQIAEELEQIGNNIHNNEHKEPIYAFIPKLNELKAKVDLIEETGLNTLVLKRILINLRNISLRLEHIYSYKNSNETISKQRSDELHKFTHKQQIDWNLFKAHLTPQSNHFRHAFRMAIVCTIAFALARTMFQSQYSYWILLSILVILKPEYSSTKKRNYERVAGTIAGGILGLVLLKYFPETNFRIVFLALFMLLAFSFMRLNYVLSVLFMTPYVLITFSFTGNDNGLSVAWERILDTVIGALLALGASYFILPTWESNQLKPTLAEMIAANLAYLRAIFERTDDTFSQSQFKLARKEVYIKSSNFTSVFQRILSEPKSKRLHSEKLHELTILNNQLTSYFATLSYQHGTKDELNEEQKRWIRSIYHLLNDAHKKIIPDAEKNEIRFRKGTLNSQLNIDFLNAIHQTASDFLKNIPNQK